MCDFMGAKWASERAGDFMTLVRSSTPDKPAFASAPVGPGLGPRVREALAGWQVGDSVLDATGYVVARRIATVSSKSTGKVVEVRTEPRVMVDLDGDIVGDSPVVFTVCEHALSVLTPH